MISDFKEVICVSNDVPMEDKKLFVDHIIDNCPNILESMEIITDNTIGIFGELMMTRSDPYAFVGALRNLLMAGYFSLMHHLYNEDQVSKLEKLFR